MFGLVSSPSHHKFKELAQQLEGEFYFDETMRRLYATDASAYRQMPLAVALPRSEADIRLLITEAANHGWSLIPRTAGTSLAGQVVGDGIVVDVSKYFNRILEVNREEHWVRVQPGVIRDDLNVHLKPFGYFFSPETSTANRAMIGGMVGNNSCGANSIVYGTTREHLLEVKGFLSDGTPATFGPLDAAGFDQKCNQKDLEGEIYRHIRELMSDPEARNDIAGAYPRPSIKRRNTGYAVDQLMDLQPFETKGAPFNFCKLIAGSEGTLFFITEIKVHLDPLPPSETGLVCAHFETVEDSLKATLVAMQHTPTACELMDHYVLECTKTNIEQRKNRFFVEGDPGAILVIEFREDSPARVQARAEALVADLKAQQLGYHYPLVTGEDTSRVWTLRKAGLGLLSNMPGDAKPAPVIEDTAVDVADLPAYIREFNQTLKKYDLYCVHYAHAGAGELHLRPILNLKTEEGTRLFRTIAEEIAHLVKKYNGSLSGEHGDGRLRGEYIRFMIGEKNYERLRKLKYTWDPKGVFNPGKIVDTPAMDTHLRYRAGQDTPTYDTYFRFEREKGIVRAAELCNGSGDCRKSHLSGGTMCPSYMATKSEQDTTRARANILREVLNQQQSPNAFDSEEIMEVMDLCLSCKGCKSECPSNVDVAKLKAEFLQQYYQSHRVPFRTRLIAGFTKGNQLASIWPASYNFLVKNAVAGGIFKHIAGFAPDRSLPPLNKVTFQRWFKKHYRAQGKESRKILIFADEFTNYNDLEVGQAAVRLLNHIGIEMEMPSTLESGRTYLSKGLLKQARTIAEKNVDRLYGKVSKECPIVGLEPSAILTLRDEYPELVREPWREKAEAIANHVYLFEEYVCQLADDGLLTPGHFHQEDKLLKVHGHCHQKALSSMTFTKKILSLPENYTMHLIPSGCCGMAGSFGYEKEHYDLSMEIGELVLLPTVRKQPEDVIIVAAGTSCRHQIKDGTGRKSVHPAQVLWQAIKK